MANTHNEVAHNWAHKTGRKARGCNLFYDGNSIFSYGRHFEIARHVKDIHGNDVVLFNYVSRSVSTSSHQRIVRRAIPSHLEVLYIPGLESLHILSDDSYSLKRACKDLAAEFEACLTKAAKRRNANYAAFDMEAAETWLDRHNAIIHHFGLAIAPLEMPANAKAFLAEKQAAIAAEAARKQAAEKEALRDWLHGAQVRPPHTSIPYVRVLGDMLQTSWGINVPLRQALPIFRLAKACAAKGKAFHPSKRHMVGDWRLDHVAADGTIRAGCHLIPLKVQIEAAKIAGIAA